MVFTQDLFCFTGEDFMSVNQQETIHSSGRLDSSAMPNRPKKGQTPE